MRRSLAILGALLALSAALSGCIDRGFVGEPVPAFEVVTVDGERVNETTHLGRFLVLDLMATWCGPCEIQTRHLQDVQHQFGDRVAILSISVDPAETLEDMEQFSRDNGLDWPHALDPSGKVGRTFRADRLPTVLVIDPQGLVVEEGQGELLPAAIARAIDPTSSPPAADLPVLATAAAALVGLLAWMNPYQRFHQPLARASSFAAVAAFAALGLLAWRFGSEASARASLGSLFMGTLSLFAVVWWARARRKQPGVQPQRRGGFGAALGDRVYEAAPHFALALVLALRETTTIGFALPLVAFLAGAAASVTLAPRLDERRRVALGLAGLALAGAGLLAYGMRLVLVEV